MAERVCSECAFCAHEGEGYSEWTITGENMVCMKKLRPDIDTDCMRERDVEEAAKFAETCDQFHEGTGPRLGLFSEDEEKDLAEWAASEGVSVPEYEEEVKARNKWRHDLSGN